MSKRNPYAQLALLGDDLTAKEIRKATRYVEKNTIKKEEKKKPVKIALPKREETPVIEKPRVTQRPTDLGKIKIVLCENILKKKSCQYKDNCRYAHSLAEQKLDKNRTFIISVLTNRKLRLDKIDFKSNPGYYDILSLFTKLCDGCKTKKCAGGYNCKYGSPLLELVVCASDLKTGLCELVSCKYQHLTTRGLICYDKQMEEPEDEPVQINLKSKTNMLSSILGISSIPDVKKEEVEDTGDKIDGYRELHKRELTSSIIQEAQPIRAPVDLEDENHNLHEYYGMKKGEDEWI